ncbi:hypothetical protein [Paenibacillus campi]|uniref:hypothetical protein n=1 Tax=Paenibacillus campi TaxID=3106031 RepID=UPI002B0007C7|nr:hypothetical protein [Paenibacillus sp. SGZ-1009]
MQNLSMLRNFNELYEDFQNGQFDLVTVSNILVSIRKYENDLTHEQIKLLLNIPINIMEHDVEISNYSEFMEFGGYFSGNITSQDDEILNKFKEKFRLKQYDLQDIISLTKYVQDNIELIDSDIELILRNPEVTIRDDIKLLEYSNFKKSGRVFAKQIKEAVDL